MSEHTTIKNCPDGKPDEKMTSALFDLFTKHKVHKERGLKAPAEVIDHINFLAGKKGLLSETLAKFCLDGKVDEELKISEDELEVAR
jgi:hypothetical protein